MNVTTVIGNLRDAEAFPDRWEGLAPFDAVVWGGGMVPPSRLSEDAANALLEWNERGGNFVIALPAAGDPWSIGTAGRHAFSGMLPATAPTRIEDVRIADILPMLSLIDALRAPDARTRLAVFDPATLTGGWRPFIAAPARKSPQGVPEVPSGSIDASVLGIRREVGFGHMTVLGLDVEEIAARGLQSPAIPEGDVFWNRILGRRADTPSGQEYTALDAAQRLTGGGYSRTIGDGVLVAQEIGLAGEAAVGVLAATAVFTLYWLIAGPLGFAVLKSMKKERWSWVAYVAVAACFTAGTMEPRASRLIRARVLIERVRAASATCLPRGVRSKVHSKVSRAASVSRCPSTNLTRWMLPHAQHRSTSRCGGLAPRRTVGVACRRWYRRSKSQSIAT
jgi:hypothetical protein